MVKLGTKPALAVGITAAMVFGASGVSAARAVTDKAAPTTSPAQPGERRGPGPGGPGLGRADTALAKELGVSVSQLQDAVKAIREAEAKPDPAAARSAEIKALASGLGTDAATIEKVLDAQRPAGKGKGDGPKGTTPPTPPTGTDAPTPPTPPTGTDAPKPPTGTDAPKPPTGTDAPKPPTGSTPPAGEGPAGGPGRGGPGHHGGPLGGGPRGARADDAALVKALASATGKDEAAVKAALEKLDTARKAEAKEREAAFAKQLAAKLGLDESKVAAAIEAARPTPPARSAKEGTAKTK